MNRFLRSFWLWFAAALTVGVVVLTYAPSTSTTQQRIAHLESIVRCPACEGLSVAQSNSPSAVAVRHQIEQRVRQGQSDTAILTAIEHQYGSAILLSPRASGLGSLLWAIPLIVVLIGIGIYARLARRST